MVSDSGGTRQFRLANGEGDAAVHGGHPTPGEPLVGAEQPLHGGARGGSGSRGRAWTGKGCSPPSTAGPVLGRW